MVKIFFILIGGSLQQAVDVVESCLEYECTPYLRYPVALYYVLTIQENFNDIPLMSEMKYKTCIANLVYKLADKERLSSHGFEHFVQKLKLYSFNEKLFNALSQNGITTSSLDTKKMADITANCLEKFYIALETN